MPKIPFFPEYSQLCSIASTANRCAPPRSDPFHAAEKIRITGAPKIAAASIQSLTD